MIPLRNWTKFKVGSIKVIYYILQYPLPKKLEAPIDAVCTISLGWNMLCTHHFKIPKVITHMSCHTTILEILDTIIISLVLVLIEIHTRPLDLFLIFGTMESMVKVLPM